MKKTAFFLLILVLSSCSPMIKISDVYKTRNIKSDELKNNKISFWGAKTINIKAYENTFADEYSDTTKLNSHLLNRFVHELGLQGLSEIKISEEKGEFPEELKVDTSDIRPNPKILQFFDEQESDYLIVINHITISELNIHNMRYFENGVMMGGGYSENCYAAINFSLWEVSNRTRLIKATAHGKSSVTFFAYLSALNDAINQSVQNIVGYIANDFTRGF